MQNTYPSCNLLITNLKLTNQEYRIYQYLCSQYNIRNQEPFVRMVNVAGFFQISLDTVKELLLNISTITVSDKKLLTIKHDNTYIIFDMPYYKSFLQSLGFKKNFTSVGYKNFDNVIKKLAAEIVDKKYLFANLDQFNLSEALRDLPDDDFQNITPNQLRFPWVYYDEKARRTDNR